MRKLLVGVLSALALSAAMSGAFAKGHYPDDPPLGAPGPIPPTAQRQYAQDLRMQARAPFYGRQNQMLGYYRAPAN